MKRNAVIILSILLVIFVMAGLLAKRKHDLAKAQPAQVLPVVVDTVVLNRQPVILSIPAMGIVSSDVSTTISTKVDRKSVV
jgi:uncharacterized membrane protein SirB2